jgi:hypothetical protein
VARFKNQKNKTEVLKTEIIFGTSAGTKRTDRRNPSVQYTAAKGACVDFSTVTCWYFNNALTVSGQLVSDRIFNFFFVIKGIYLQARCMAALAHRLQCDELS